MPTDLAKFELVARDGFFPVAIFCSSESDFILLDLARESFLEAMERQAALAFVGVAACDKDWKPLSALNLPLDGDVINTLSQAYIRHVETSIEAFAAKYMNVSGTSPRSDH